MIDSKHPDTMQLMYDHMKEELLHWLEAALASGVTMFSYADPIGARSILGPKMSRQVVHQYTLPFMKLIKEKICCNATVFLCPQIVSELKDANLVEIRPSEQRTETFRFAGTSCVHNAHFKLVEQIKLEYVLLKS